MKKYIILLMILTLSLFAKENDKFSLGFSVNSILVDDTNYGYFSKDDLATEVSVDFLYEVIQNVSVGVNLENLIDKSEENSFDYLAANLVLSYSYNLIDSLDVFATVNGGYQRSYFTLSDKSFTNDNIIVTPYLGFKYKFKFGKANIGLSYELGYKYQTDIDLKFKKYSRDLDYGTFSGSGMKHKFKISLLF